MCHLRDEEEGLERGHEGANIGLKHVRAEVLPTSTDVDEAALAKRVCLGAFYEDPEALRIRQRVSLDVVD